jgi:hypothetical protein
MGNLISTCLEIVPEKSTDQLILDTYKNWIDCLFYDEKSREKCIIIALNSIGITDMSLIEKHISNEETKIRTPSDFVASKVVNILTSREKRIYLKPWEYYKIRESNNHDIFVISDDPIEEIALDNYHLFWTILSVVNNIETDSIRIDEAHLFFWIKMCILIGNRKLAERIAYYYYIDISIFESFRKKYSPINYPLVPNTINTE